MTVQTTAAPSAAVLRPRTHGRLAALLPGPPAAVTAVVSGGYTLFAGWQWTHGVVKSWDLGIFTQAMQGYAALRPPVVPIKGPGYVLLGDHFHPLLAVLAPVFALFPHAFTLLVVQAVCFGIAAGLVAAAAGRRLGPVQGALVGVAFGGSWGLQYAADAQFHEVALAVPLLTASLCALLDRRMRAAVGWAAPLVFVKEDLGFTVAGIGLLIVLAGRPRLGASLAGWGLGWTALAVLVILPALNPGHVWAYGDQAAPGAAADLLDPAKGGTLLLVAAAGAGLAFRSPIALLLLPTLAWRFLSANRAYWGPEWHYSAVLMPVVFVALLDGVDRVRRSPRGWVRRTGRGAALLAVGVALVLAPRLPLAQVLQGGGDPERIAAADAVLRMIPPGASVETDIALMHRVVDDHPTTWTGNANPAPDCVLVDPGSGMSPTDWSDVATAAERLHPGVDYRPEFEGGGYRLACRTPLG